MHQNDGFAKVQGESFDFSGFAVYWGTHIPQLKFGVDSGIHVLKHMQCLTEGFKPSEVCKQTQNLIYTYDNQSHNRLVTEYNVSF